VCGNKRDKEHKWQGRTCSVCGDNRDAELYSELLAASQKGDVNAVSALLSTGIDVNKIIEELWGFSQFRRKTALYVASHFLQPEVVKVLLAAHADVNAKVENGETALHIACSCCISRSENDPAVKARIIKRQVEVVKLLLAAGADVHVQNDFHRTPFDETTGCEEVRKAAILEALSVPTAKRDNKIGSRN
jgi:ankyrin repeat protein